MTLLQIIAVCFMVGYVYHRSVGEAAYFAALAQSHSEVYTDAVALRHYNQIQQERSAEREDLQMYIDKRIDLKLSQAITPAGGKQ
ncbi:hypothetical protein D9M68_42440 [compost metagenome]